MCSSDLGFYFRVRGGSTTATNDLGTELYPGIEGVAVSTSWTFYEGQVTVPSAMKWARVFALVYTTNTGASILVDQVEFKKVVKPGSMSVGSLSAISANLGTVTAGTIQSGNTTNGVYITEAGMKVYSSGVARIKLGNLSVL